jgi:ribosomal protein L17
MNKKQYNSEHVPSGNEINSQNHPISKKTGILGALSTAISKHELAIIEAKRRAQSLADKALEKLKPKDNKQSLSSTVNQTNTLKERTKSKATEIIQKTSNSTQEFLNRGTKEGIKKDVDKLVEKAREIDQKAREKAIEIITDPQKFIAGTKEKAKELKTKANKIITDGPKNHDNALREIKQKAKDFSKDKITQFKDKAVEIADNAQTVIDEQLDFIESQNTSNAMQMDNIPEKIEAIKVGLKEQTQLINKNIQDMAVKFLTEPIAETREAKKTITNAMEEIQNLPKKATAKAEVIKKRILKELETLPVINNVHPISNVTLNRIKEIFTQNQVKIIEEKGINTLEGFASLLGQKYFSNSEKKINQAIAMIVESENITITDAIKNDFKNLVKYLELKAKKTTLENIRKLKI